MNKLNHKLLTFISFLVILFLIFIFFIFKDYSYEKKYTLDKFNVVEKYNNSNYIFNIEYENTVYNYVISNKYLHKRMLIEEIEIQEDEQETCILPKSNKLEFYPLCSSNNIVYTYNLSSLDKLSYKYKDIKSIDKEYNKININYLGDLSFLLYNYRGFYLVNKDNNKEIKLFNRDVYTLDLIYQYNEFLLIPDYNENYYYHKIYLININNGKVKEIKFDYEISFDTVFLGDYKGYIYILDKKEEKEYRINIKNNKIEETSFYILENNKLVTKNYKEIITNELSFSKDELYTYELIDNTLYYVWHDYNIKISNLNISKIIKYDKESVYYLSNDNLYMYNNTYGEVLLLTNFEWNFNNTNMIFISK